MIWDCEAYGPDGKAVDALCFFAEPGTRACGTQGECHIRLADERVRVFGRIQEMAVDGDPAGQYLAEAFTDPEQMLGGALSPANDEAEDGSQNGR